MFLYRKANMFCYFSTNVNTMIIIKQIPNIITLGNLFCGVLATISAVRGDFEKVLLFVLLGVFLDFFDGLAARLLKVSGDLGKQLDSLADMVTSGVAPGITMYMLIGINAEQTFNESFLSLALLGLVLTLGACFRLAKFNIDERQTDSFIGLPTPAMAIFITSLPIILESSSSEFITSLLHNNYILIGISIFFTLLMNAEIPLFSLKFKNYSFSKNWLKYVFLAVSLVLIIVLELVAIPIIILFYVFLSVIMNLVSKPKI